MNRDIKFRAWNPDDNKMEYPLVFAKWNNNENIKPLITCKDGNRAYKDYSLMQFTGLKLKDGTELYEGDKLKYTKHSGYIMEDSILEICWDDEYACFGYKTNTSMFHDMIFAFVNHDCLQEDVLNHCELIGNIYQNE